jgi:hypothetical protein
MTAMRKAALAAITILVAAASVASFAESYRALYDWATRHGLHGVWAAAWPLQIDVFIAVGELALLVGLCDRWRKRDRIAAWIVTGLGLAVSIAGNVGHVASHDWTSRMTAAVPPLAAAAALAVGLGVLKRVVAKRAPEPRPQRGTESAPRTRTRSAPKRRTPAAPIPHAALNGHGDHAVTLYAAELASGAVPSIRRIRREMHVGQPRAELVQAYLAELANGEQRITGSIATSEAPAIPQVTGPHTGDG